MASIHLLGLQNKKEEKRSIAVREASPRRRIFCKPALVGGNNFPHFLQLRDQL